MRHLFFGILLLIFAGLSFAQTTTIVASSADQGSTAETYGSVPKSIAGVIVATMAITEIVKVLVFERRILGSIPIWVYVVAISVILTVLSNKVFHSLQGDLPQLLWESLTAALASSGFYEWLRTFKKPLNAKSTSLSSAGVAMLIVCVGIFSLGCNETKLTTFREGVAAGIRPINAEYLKWTDEKVAAGQLTADDARIRKNSVLAVEDLIETSRRQDPK